MNYKISLPSLLMLFCLYSAHTLASPDIAHWKTSNGLKVYFVNAPEIPILDVRLVYNAGSAQDGDQYGLARLTASLLDEGAGELDANAFNERLASTGAKFSAGALRDMAWISLRSLSDAKYSQPALSLFRQAATQATFSDAAVARVKAATLTKIRRDAASPGSIANKAIRKAVFGDHPYAHPTEGEEATLAEIAQQDVISFYQRHYVLENAVLAIVGALTSDQARVLAEQIASELPRGKPAPAIPPVSMLEQQSTELIAFDSIQSHVRVGMPGMKRGDEDYVPLFVGNHVLGGGGLVSILFDEIREKRGLSYGVNSYFAPSEQLGIFVASLQTDGSQAEQALTVLVETMQEFINNGPPLERLEAAKQNLVGGFPLRVDSNSEIIEYIAMIGFYDLPLDYLETFPKKVAAVDADQIKQAFARRINLERSAIVVVGKQNAAEKS